MDPVDPDCTFDKDKNCPGALLDALDSERLRTLGLPGGCELDESVRMRPAAPGIPGLDGVGGAPDMRRILMSVDGLGLGAPGESMPSGEEEEQKHQVQNLVSFHILHYMYYET